MKWSAEKYQFMQPPRLVFCSFLFGIVDFLLVAFDLSLLLDYETRVVMRTSHQHIHPGKVSLVSVSSYLGHH